MKILVMTLKKKWFEMIISGEKKEEYREIKSYWLTRFKHYCNGSDMIHEFNHDYTHILFKNGYSKNSPSFTIELIDVNFGFAKPEWSDNWKGEVIIIKLGKIINI